MGPAGVWDSEGFMFGKMDSFLQLKGKTDGAVALAKADRRCGKNSQSVNLKLNFRMLFLVVKSK
jgi:hypothetical protein